MAPPAVPPSVVRLAAAALPARPSSTAAVVHGTGDRLIAPENAVEIADAVQHGRLTLVADAGHMIAQERPSAVAAAVATLLEAVVTGRTCEGP